jgi:hypothetical protein
MIVKLSDLEGKIFKYDTQPPSGGGEQGLCLMERKD